VLTQSGIRALLSAWPNIRIVSLNPRLIQSSGWTLSNIDVLVVIRRYAPSTLEHFGIAIDPQITRNPLIQHSSLPLMLPSSLRSLDIGTFRVAVSYFLRDHCFIFIRTYQAVFYICISIYFFASSLELRNPFVLSCLPVVISIPYLFCNYYVKSA